MFLTKLRRPADTYAPWLSHFYRSLRDLTSWRFARQTAYGFDLAGNSEMASARFEPKEVEAFLGQCETCDVVIDIGANVGFYTCLSASRGKRVVSFEPALRNLKFLYRNLWSNGFAAVEVLPVGLGREPGLKPIYGFGGISSLIRGWAQAPNRRAGLVPVTTLDLVMENRFPGKRLFIKMDVEGFESEVLAGASGMLNRFPKPVWMVEIQLSGGPTPDRINHCFGETFDFFWKGGYKCEAFGPGQKNVTADDVNRWIKSGFVESGAINFLFYGN